jgi:hypothetical protein
MKKILLAALCLAGSFITAKANMLTFINMTGCDFNFNIDGAIGTTGSFVANGVIIPPGTTVFANPAVTPNVFPFGTGNLSTGTFQVVKGYDIPGGPAFVIGSILGLPTSYSSATNGHYPACYAGSDYWAYWNGGTDIVVLIF